MTAQIQPQLQPDPDFPSRLLPGRRRFNKQHSARVRVLKRGFGGLAIILVLAVLIWPLFQPTLPAAIVKELMAQVAAGMVNPEYHGIDRRLNPFVVRAATAKPVGEDTSVIDLVKPNADFKSAGGAAINVTAAAGRFQEKENNLALAGDVVFAHENGAVFSSSALAIDFNKNTAHTTVPVKATGKFGEITGSGLSMQENGEVITFAAPARALLNAAGGVENR